MSPGAALGGAHLGQMEHAEPKPPETPAARPEPLRPPPEVGGPKGPEPTRYGDWEVKGRCTDF